MTTNRQRCTHTRERGRLERRRVEGGGSSHEYRWIGEKEAGDEVSHQLVQDESGALRGMGGQSVNVAVRTSLCDQIDGQTKRICELTFVSKAQRRRNTSMRGVDTVTQHRTAKQKNGVCSCWSAKSSEPGQQRTGAGALFPSEKANRAKRAWKLFLYSSFLQEHPRGSSTYGLDVRERTDRSRGVEG
ncbi:hypothetical protein BCV70DRAFT_200230 [Testicularia cyperi]|uniref:Uncharacterized protein n=1 Tax=Testicularia cyperi TaxID=1882483 RepID=A0A317XRY5_9BASI|nr:hypothetical protein BCV70DRAFT_200230 [Testicularia cyperi]